jgi:signal transduction histidine kinase/CHASE2 domain-containing sensor protein
VKFFSFSELLSRLSFVLIAGLIYFLLHLGGILPALSDQFLDLLFLQRGVIAPSQDIVIIAVDDDSLSRFGAWPFARRLHAELLRHLEEATVVGFDFLFTEPTPDDPLLSDAFKHGPPVVLAAARSFQGKFLLPAPTISNYQSIGLVQTFLSHSGVVRRAGHPSATTAGNTIPPFAWALLQNTSIATGHSPPVGTFLINYYGPIGTFLYLSYADVLDGVYAKDFFRNRLVLVGVRALGIGDVHLTPFSSTFPMPGVEIQATVLNNYLDNSRLREPRFILPVLLTAVILLSLLVWPLQSERKNIVLNTLLLLLMPTISFVLFKRAVFLDTVGPVIFLILLYLVYLVGERIWSNSVIVHEVKRLDRQLQKRMHSLYTNMPEHFSPRTPHLNQKGTRSPLRHLQAGVKTLELQHHFIETLLGRDLPPLILWDTRTGNVILANTMFRHFWEQHSGRKKLPALPVFSEHLGKKLSRDSGQELQQVLESGGEKSNFDIGLHGPGGTSYYRVHLNPVVVRENEFNGLLAIFTDITEIKELERIKGEIVSIASHELKLPLTVILGYAEMLEATLTGSEKTFIDKIVAQAVRLKKLIEVFLDIARLEHGKEKIRRLPFKPLSVAEEALQAVSGAAEQKSIALVSQLPRKTTPAIGDQSLLVQAVTNLLDNAIKFSPSDTTVTLRLVEEEEQFVFCVIDQGPGIPASEQEQIFQKFNRGANKPEEEGFGLGLNFVQEIIRQHGGEIFLDRNLTRGAGFCFTLPKHDDGGTAETPGTETPA